MSIQINVPEPKFRAYGIRIRLKLPKVCDGCTWLTRMLTKVGIISARFVCIGTNERYMTYRCRTCGREEYVKVKRQENKA
jgi:hypothetical protein